MASDKVNGLPAIRFSGDALITSYLPPTGAAPRTLIAVIANGIPNAESGNRFVWACGGIYKTGDLYSLCFQLDANENNDHSANMGLKFSMGPASGLPSKAAPSSAPTIVTVRREGDRHEFLVNGVSEQIWQRPMSTASSRALRLGANLRGNDSHFAGDIAEVIVYESALHEAEHKAVLDYLSAKYGITL